MENSSFVISTHVINTINALPTDERVAITTALAAEMILGENPKGMLTPMQQLLYTMIRRYVAQDSARPFQGVQRQLDSSDFDARRMHHAV